MIAGDDAAFEAAVREAPAELSEAAAVVTAADPDVPSPDAEAAVAEIVDWVQLNCQSAHPGESRRHVAPPLDAVFDGLVFCGTTTFPAMPVGGDSGMVLYGAADADDPYDGPMLGVLWNPAADGTHRGDGEPVPVTVRGHDGVAAPITVFQQTILPELGTVIACEEGDTAIGLYGRGWPIDRADELVAFADRLEEVDGGLRLADDALPDGYAQVFTGSPAVASLVFPPAARYSLRYQGDSGLLDVQGLQMSADEFEAFRFFTLDVDQGDVGGRAGLVGNAWNAAGPAVVTWREADALVVRIVGLGVPFETVREVADRSRELTDEQWSALVGADDECQGP